MGDISLPQPQDYYRIEWSNGLYSNNVDADQIGPLVAHYAKDSGLIPTKIEHVVVTVEVTDVTAEVEAVKQQKIDMWKHLKEVHDNVVYIGNVFEIHAEDYPECSASV